MFCGNCGSPIKEGSRFCGNCGRPIDMPIGQSEPVYIPEPIPGQKGMTNPKKKKPIYFLVPAVIAVVVIIVAAIMYTRRDTPEKYMDRLIESWQNVDADLNWSLILPVYIDALVEDGTAASKEELYNNFIDAYTDMKEANDDEYGPGWKYVYVITSKEKIPREEFQSEMESAMNDYHYPDCKEIVKLTVDIDIKDSKGDLHEYGHGGEWYLGKYKGKWYTIPFDR